MAEHSYRIPIFVALIGVAGTIGAALIANWDKLFSKAEPAPQVAPTTPATGLTVATPATPALQLAGVWRDAANPSIVSTITQDGNRIRFARTGSLPNGVAFESDGSGTLDGLRLSTQYVARYLNGQSSSGQCTGTVTPTATSIALQCVDTLLGSFQSASVRR
jgi:hypothetical protein